MKPPGAKVAIIEPGIVPTPNWNRAEALMTDERYPVGLDAEAIAAARDRMTAGAWAALLTEEDEERFVLRAVEGGEPEIGPECATGS